jgi:hypothetical protein
MTQTSDVEKVEPEQPWTPSRALVAQGPHTGAILEYEGSGITNEIHEAGLHALDELGLDDAPEGLSIWEGEYVWEDGWFEGHRSPANGQAHPKGEFRRLKPEEWATLSANQPLWPRDAEEAEG